MDWWAGAHPTQRNGLDSRLSGNDGIKEVEIMKQKRDGAAIWAGAGDKRQVV